MNFYLLFYLQKTFFTIQSLPELHAYPRPFPVQFMQKKQIYHVHMVSKLVF